ncbi:MAG: lipoyl(octanoyl) transferase [Gloeocapsa sp. DLM2.Bin57]|nr:MAG: lipoyl(octanoyl) transferase [Gloeocapsa sp. DLM2.Bin57]
MLKKCLLIQDDLIPYPIAWQRQQKLVKARLDNQDLTDILWLLGHPCVYTLGTGANLAYLKDLNQSEYQVYRIERGGEVTYHYPGQIVGYPILNLHHYQTDLHWYLRQLEEVIIQLLKIYDLQAYRLPGFTGVWLEGYKIAAIGIKVKRWITMHGFAVNVYPDLAGFGRIIPCGISDKPVGCLTQFLPELTLTQVRDDLPQVFAEVFQVCLDKSCTYPE